MPPAMAPEVALLNMDKRQEAQKISRWVRYIETAVDPDFQTEFVSAMHLPNKVDSFPHLDGILPIIPKTSEPRRKRRRTGRQA